MTTHDNPAGDPPGGNTSGGSTSGGSTPGSTTGPTDGDAGADATTGGTAGPGAGTQDGASGGHPGHGSLSDEALRLAETLQAWISTGAAMTGAGTASECKVCPLCQAIALVNNLKPDVLGHLTEAGLALAAAFRAATEPTGGGDGTEARSWASSDRPPVQRITVT